MAPLERGRRGPAEPLVVPEPARLLWVGRDRRAIAVLRAWGVECVCAGAPGPALEALRRNGPIDLAVAPAGEAWGAEGIAALAAEVPVVMLADGAGPEALRAGYDAGAFSLVPAGLSPLGQAQAVHRCLGRIPERRGPRRGRRRRRGGPWRRRLLIGAAAFAIGVALAAIPGLFTPERGRSGEAALLSLPAEDRALPRWFLVEYLRLLREANDLSRRSLEGVWGDGTPRQAVLP